MKNKEERLRVVPLGGLDEIGKNMTVIEYGDDMVVIDAGLMFPDDDSPGIDLILPDYSYILHRQHKLRGIVITHGHEDHTGALPYLLKDLGRPVPVLGTKLTLGLINGKLEEHRLKKVKLREIQPGGHVTVGPFGFDFIPMNHSIPDGVAVLIRTPVGNILHTGDFKLDQTPIDGRVADYSALTRAGAKGVMLMLSDSTNAETPGFTRSEAVVGAALREIFAEAEQRIIVASFASHIHRMQQVCDAAVENGRKVVVTGRSMITNTRIARELGYLQIGDDDIVDAYDMNGLAADEVVVMCTGSQGEPLSALARMANRDHKTVSVEEGDTVVISASPVPGNEKAVNRVINRLSKAGANVLYKGRGVDVHVSGHAAAEELKLVLNLVKPTYFVPVHGENRHLRAHVKLAKSVGVAEENIYMLEIGQVLEFDANGVARATERVESGVTYVDGLKVGDIGEVVLRDRQQLSSDGIAMVVVTIDARTGRVVGDPELIMRGVTFDGKELADQARARLGKALGKTSREGVTDQSIIRNTMRESLSQLIWENSRRRPMIIPVVMEV